MVPSCGKHCKEAKNSKNKKKIQKKSSNDKKETTIDPIDPLMEGKAFNIDVNNERLKPFIVRRVTYTEEEKMLAKKLK